MGCPNTTALRIAQGAVVIATPSHSDTNPKRKRGLSERNESIIIHALTATRNGQIVGRHSAARPRRMPAAKTQAAGRLRSRFSASAHNAEMVSAVNAHSVIG